MKSNDNKGNDALNSIASFLPLGVCLAGRQTGKVVNVKSERIHEEEIIIPLCRVKQLCSGGVRKCTDAEPDSDDSDSTTY